MIYVIEDERSIRDLVLYALRQSGFEAEGFETGAPALARETPELYILDIMLPDMNGMEILRKIRERGRTPVIMLTALSDEENKLAGFDGGADGYITKPFGVMELIARVKAMLRSSGPRLGGIEINDKTHTVTALGSPVELTFKEYELLKFLMDHSGEAFDRERILGEVWGIDYFGGTRTVDVHIQTLRQKLGAAGGMISTVRGVGYKFGEDKN